MGTHPHSDVSERGPAHDLRYAAPAVLSQQLWHAPQQEQEEQGGGVALCA